MINCKTCNKETSNPLFCSKSCAVTFNNAHKKKKVVTRACKRCNQVFVRKNWRDGRLLCVDCARLDSETTRNMTLKEYRGRTALLGRHPSWITSGIRGFCRSWNKYLKNKSCSNCGYDKHTEMCHKKPLAKFPETATLGEINHPDNIVVLCPNCHWEFDNGYLKL